MRRLTKVCLRLYGRWPGAYRLKIRRRQLLNVVCDQALPRWVASTVTWRDFNVRRSSLRSAASGARRRTARPRAPTFSVVPLDRLATLLARGTLLPASDWDRPSEVEGSRRSRSARTHVRMHVKPGHARHTI